MKACFNHPEVIEGVVRCWRCMRPFCRNCRVMMGGKSLCGDCKLEHVADVRSGVVQGAIELAGIGRRWAALFVDGLVLLVPLWIILFLFLMPWAMREFNAGTSAPEMPVFFNFIGFLYIPIYVVYEGLMLGSRGQTVGKIALGIKVVTPSGGEISKGQAWGRAILRNVFISFLAIVNYLPALFTKEKTCVHDLVAGTRVVRLS